MIALKVVLSGEVDLTIARVSYTPSRARVVDFSPRYYSDGTGLVTKDISKTHLADFAQSAIAVLENSSTIAALRHYLPDAELVGVESYQEALQILEAGQADAFAADSSLLTGWVQEHPQYKHLAFYLSGESLAIVMPKGLQYKELRGKVNQAISDWQQSGWLRQRADYWGLP